MDIYTTLETKLNKIIDIYRNLIGNNFHYIKNDKATLDEVEKIESQLGFSLPSSFKDFFLNFSKKLCFYAQLPDDFELPDELMEIFSSEISFDLDKILENKEYTAEWCESCFTNPNDEYDKVWYNKLALMIVGNGDCIAFDLNDPKEDKRIVYLSHDGDSNHGYVLGNNFYDFFDKYLSICCVGSECWQMSAFLENKFDGINPKCENANLLRKILNVNFD